MASPPGRLFFAYGSSLSISEMRTLCPTSSFYSVAILRYYRWFVNERGNANIAPSRLSPGSDEDAVWGILYMIRPFDEESLDKHEGMPWAYSKEDMDVETVSFREDGRSTKREVVRAFVYIDRERALESYPYPDFVSKMHGGIQDAIERGVPKGYIDKIVRSRLMLAESATNSSQAKNGNESSMSPYDGPKAAQPNFHKDMDLTVRTHGLEAGGQALNGTSPTTNASQHGRVPGLQDSRYANRNDTYGQPPVMSTEQEASADWSAPSSPRFKPGGRKKLECWWWRTQGFCQKSDDECHFAHYETGNVATVPGKKAKGFLAAQAKKAARADKNEFRQPARQGYQGPRENDAPESHFSKMRPFDNHISVPDEGFSNHQSLASAPAQTGNVTGATDYKWEGDQQASETWAPNKPAAASEGTAPVAEPQLAKGTSQVENLMDSQPEWLISNDRPDVQW